MNYELAGLKEEGGEASDGDIELYETDSENGETELFDCDEKSVGDLEIFNEQSERSNNENAENGDVESQSNNNSRDTQVIESNNYIFEIDSQTGTTTARGKVTVNPASREGMSNIHPDGYDSSTHKGHLIAAKEGGPAKGFNVHAQDAHLNQGEYKTVENAETRAADAHIEVNTEKTAYISNKGSKPDAYMINDTFVSKDGKSQSVHLSFQNASPDEQQQWNDIADENSDYDEYSNPDPLRESMTESEYSALMVETDSQLPSIRDEFDLDNTIETNSDSINTADNSSHLGGPLSDGFQSGETEGGE